LVAGTSSRGWCGWKVLVQVPLESDKGLLSSTTLL